MILPKEGVELVREQHLTVRTKESELEVLAEAPVTGNGNGYRQWLVDGTERPRVCSIVSEFIIARTGTAGHR